MLQTIFELIPVALAIVAAILCARRFGFERRRNTKVFMGLAVVCAVLLVIAQSSWWASYVVQGVGEGTAFADAIWTVFNTLVMISFIVTAKAPVRS